MKTTTVWGRWAAFSGIVSIAVLSTVAACSSSSSGGSGDDVVSPTEGGADVTTSNDAGVDAARAEPSTKLAVRYESTCALVGGQVKCWGNNPEGELGYFPVDNNPHPTPATVGGISFTPTILALGDDLGCTGDGTQITCWGEDYYGELGAPADAGCAPGPYCPPVTTRAFTGFDSMSIGYITSCAHLTNGTVSCMGSDFYGQLGASSDGGATYEPITIAGLANVAEVGLGEYSSCARMTDGTVACWGMNDHGQLGQKTGPGAGFDNVMHPNPLTVPGIHARQLSVGPLDVCVVSTDGTVSCWGSNAGENPHPGGQLGHDPTTDSPCTSGSLCDPTPTQVAGLTDVREVAAGWYFTCAVKNDDTVVCWGGNDRGELESAPSSAADAGSYPYNFNPQPMPGLTNIAHVIAGYKFACAITWDNHVLCWGENNYGQLGVPPVDGGAVFSPTPVTPTGF